jgi:hypothetical protein
VVGLIVGGGEEGSNEGVLEGANDMLGLLEGCGPSTGERVGC